MGVWTDATSLALSTQIEHIHILQSSSSILGTHSKEMQAQMHQDRYKNVHSSNICKRPTLVVLYCDSDMEYYRAVTIHKLNEFHK